MAKSGLAGVITGKITSPIKTAVYGPPGAGKSTFASGAPSVIYMPVEEGTNSLDVTRFPAPESFADVRAGVAELITADHKYKTLAIDTLDALEPLIWAHVCQAGGKKGIEDFGYGKGYVEALSQWRLLLADLERLRAVKKMGVVLICHSQIRKFQNPEGADFDQYTLKLAGKGAAGLIIEWSDCLLFASHEIIAGTDKAERTRGVATGRRIARTSHSGFADAKNRYNLPDPMDLLWDAYRAALMAFHKPTSNGASTTTAAPVAATTSTT